MEITIYAGAGLREPIQKITEDFSREKNISIVIDYAGSEILLSKILLLKRGELYIPGDKSYVVQARKAGLIQSSVDLCYFVPILMVARGNPKNIQGLEDLKRNDLRIGLGDPNVCAIGKKTEKILKKNQIESQQLHIKSYALTVNELALQVKTGSLDVVIVWDALLLAYAKDTQGVSIPLEQNIISTVPVAQLINARNTELCEQLIKRLQSPRAKEDFEKFGYRTTAPQ